MSVDRLPLTPDIAERLLHLKDGELRADLLRFLDMARAMVRNCGDLAVEASLERLEAQFAALALCPVTTVAGGRLREEIHATCMTVLNRVTGGRASPAASAGDGLGSTDGSNSGAVGRAPDRADPSSLSTAPHSSDPRRAVGSGGSAASDPVPV